MTERFRFVAEDYPRLDDGEHREKFLRNLNGLAEHVTKKLAPGGTSLGSLSGFTKEIEIGGSKAAVAAAAPDTAWHSVGGGGEPAFQNSWVNIGGAGEVSTRFKRDSVGNVWVEIATKGGAAGSVIFTLPTGYRPAGQLPAKGSEGNADAFATVQSNGNVTFIVSAPGGDGNLRFNFAFPSDDYTAPTGTAAISAFPVRFKNELPGAPSGVVILGAWNTTTSGKETPVSLGSPAWSLAQGQIVIGDVSGVLPGQKYRITVRVFG